MSTFTEEEREEYLRRRAGGGALAGPGLASSGMLSSFVSLGAAKTDARGAVVDDFIDAPKYEGSKDGYVFKMGRFGVGYYFDTGPMGPKDDFDVNAGLAPAKGYDMEAHARGEEPVDNTPKEPGHGRSGTLGELLAENKANKQEKFEAMVHANRFCPPKALDDEEEAFLAEKDDERRMAEETRKRLEKEADTQYRIAVAQQSGKQEETVDLAKVMGQAKAKAKKPVQSQTSILSRMLAVKRKGDDTGEEAPAAKQMKKAPSPEPQAGAGSALLGLAAYGDDSDSD